MREEELLELSAVIDDEADGVSLVRVSRRIRQDEEALRTLVRYQMIGDCLRGEAIDPRSVDLVEAVSRRLEDEPTVLAPNREGRRKRWLQPVAGAAIAASVAAGVVMLAPHWINPHDGRADGRGEYRVVAEPVSRAVPAPALVVYDRMHWKTVAPPYQQRLDRYLEQHSRYATQNGLQRMIPYTTLVSYGDIPRAEGE